MLVPVQVRLYEDTLASALSTDNPPTAPRPACEQPGAAAEHSSSSSSNTTWLGRLLRRRGARAQQQQQQPAPFKAGTQSPWGLSTQGTFEDELEDRPYRCVVWCGVLRCAVLGYAVFVV